LTAIGILSVILALILPLQWTGTAGWMYFIVAAYFTVSGTLFGKRHRLLRRNH
jgi:hypothetical protein